MSPKPHLVNLEVCFAKCHGRCEELGPPQFPPLELEPPRPPDIADDPPEGGCCHGFQRLAQELLFHAHDHPPISKISHLKIEKS